jgi:homoserine dehydrogenase
VTSGDEIVKIEGIFSGTLSYLFNNFSAATALSPPPFSQVVKKAKELGYTVGFSIL